MPEILTRDFGPVQAPDEALYDFPLGLPGFADHRRFALLEPRPDSPLLLLQSAAQAGVAFLALPVELLLRDYPVRMIEADLKTLGPLRGGCRTLILISLPAEGPATANLLGPVVLNPATRRGVQAIRDDDQFGAAEPLEPLLEARRAAAGEPVCS